MRMRVGGDEQKLIRGDASERPVFMGGICILK